ncbi:MAG: phosphoribosyl-ATP diphosphatase [Leptospiraceae bacterium]|nr:phosphoribosyl-ATP diphosphatase [Leptospiraceae bacterium]MDW8306134.1 phosphoribosyl-ATP diphosphatase [Leptospiraceae bacterium]
MGFIYELEKIINERKNYEPHCSYTAKLFSQGIDKILQKIGEEAVEYLIEAKNGNKERAISEAADLIYHFLVSLNYSGISLGEIEEELQRRHRP